MTLYDLCLARGRMDLLNQWSNHRNEGLLPGDVTPGSHRKVWWQCSQGHLWQSAVYTRAGQDSGCPYCTNRKVLRGFNDLETVQPDLAAQWHREKNGALRPDQVTCGSHRKVWWRCDRGHVWQALISARTGGCGCPVCANRTLLPGVNDLQTLNPALAAQWHPEKNGSLTPSQILTGSRRKVWWQCSRNHAWQASVASRYGHGTGCPVCAGKLVLMGENDLATLFPEIAAQWDPLRNGSLTPEGVTPFSNRRAWWLCEKGHRWQAAIACRTSSGSGCPYCTGRKVLQGFNDLATLQPRLAAQWHPELNGALTPERVTVGSRKKVWWQCPDGHIWRTSVYSRSGARKHGCPVCSGNVKRQTAQGP